MAERRSGSFVFAPTPPQYRGYERLALCPLNWLDYVPSSSGRDASIFFEKKLFTILDVQRRLP